MPFIILEYKNSEKENQLDTIDADFMIQCNKTKSLDYKQIGVQLDEFMV